MARHGVFERLDARWSASIVFDGFQTSTCRLTQSMMATRQSKPRRIGIWVISAHRTWLGRSIARFRSG
jgi:hypothetical protein